jgi:hypothetical protein
MKSKDRGKRVFWVCSLLFAATLAFAGSALAEEKKFICSNNNDMFTNNCKVYVEAVTRVTDGQRSTGHLVMCQSKTYTCMNGGCIENMGSGAATAFTFAMDQYAKFCSLLCTRPACSGTWQPK